jgi:nicotinamidase-related amidase
MPQSSTAPPPFGSEDLQLPAELRDLLKEHMDDLRGKFLQRGWGGRVGFGKRPALIVIDLARYWLDPATNIGANLDPVVEATVRVLDAARQAEIPIFFTTWDHDPAHPRTPQNSKLKWEIPPGKTDELFALDPRLQRRPDEKVIAKASASAFKGTNLHYMLAAVGADTLIVTGISTSHCVYATCRDATDSFHVIVPEECVGERCELLHSVNLMDIDIDLADVMPAEEVIGHLSGNP